MHDVVVVGGGPAGCYAAALLSKKGLDVHVLEEHASIGEPVDCSGVIGTEAFATLELPESLILAEINRLTLVSPSQLDVEFSPSSTLAYIVDRAAFDRVVAEQTVAAGTSLHLGTRVLDLRVLSDCVEVEVRNACGLKRLRAAMVILAGGPRYKFQRSLGMGRPANFLKTAQTEVPVRGIKETKVLLGSQVAPCSFAWIVPFKRENTGFARIGVSSKVVATPYLKKLLRGLYKNGSLASLKAPVRSWVIPITPLERTFAERVLAVGDAAGQTKPTTGGGIYYGLLCAEAAAGTVLQAFQKRDFTVKSLRRYEVEWRRKLGSEVALGAFFRRLAESLRDDEIDDLFRIVRSDGILSAVNRRARFDWHKDVIFFALRHPALARIFLRGLFR